MCHEPRIDTLSSLSPEDELRHLLEAYRDTWKISLDPKQQEQNERNHQVIADALYTFNVGFLLGLQHATPPEKLG